MSNSTLTTRASGEIDLRSLVLTLWQGRWWIIVGTFISVVVFGLVAFSTPTAYRATTVLVPVATESGSIGGLSDALGGVGGLAALAGLNVGADDNLQESLAVLRSRQFSESFISDFDLMPGIFPSRWDAEARSWKGDEDEWPTRAQAYKSFNRKVRSADHDIRTNLVSVSIVWHDPDEAALLANELVRRLNQEMRSRVIARTNASIKFLQDELKATTPLDTRQTINRLIETQMNQRMYANVMEEYALRFIDPALPPDLDDKERPKTAMMLLLGFFVGMVVAGFVVLVISALRSADADGGQT